MRGTTVIENLHIHTHITFTISCKPLTAWLWLCWHLLDYHWSWHRFLRGLPFCWATSGCIILALPVRSRLFCFSGRVLLWDPEEILVVGARTVGTWIPGSRRTCFVASSTFCVLAILLWVEDLVCGVWLVLDFPLGHPRPCLPDVNVLWNQMVTELVGSLPNSFPSRVLAKRIADPSRKSRMTALVSDYLSEAPSEGLHLSKNVLKW